MANLAQSMMSAIGLNKEKPVQRTQPQGQQGQPDPTSFKFDPATGKPNPAYKEPSAIDANNPDNLPNPTDVYAKLFKNDPEATNKTKPPTFSLDPAAVTKAASSLDFSKHITPEMTAKFANGDFSGMVDLLNGVGRQAYEHALTHSSGLTGHFMETRLAHDRSGLDQSVVGVLDKNSLSKLAEKNPALQSQIEVIGKEFRRLMPDASSEEIGKQVIGYFTDIASMVNPDAFTKKPADGSSVKGTSPDGEIDWGTYLK